MAVSDRARSRRGRGRRGLRRPEWLILGGFAAVSAMVLIVDAALQTPGSTYALPTEPPGQEPEPSVPAAALEPPPPADPSPEEALRIEPPSPPLRPVLREDAVAAGRDDSAGAIAASGPPPLDAWMPRPSSSEARIPPSGDASQAAPDLQAPDSAPGAPQPEPD